MVVEQALHPDSFVCSSAGAQCDPDVVVTVGLELSFSSHQPTGHHSLAELTLTERLTTVGGAPGHVAAVQLSGPHEGCLVDDNALVKELL